MEQIFKDDLNLIKFPFINKPEKNFDLTKSLFSSEKDMEKLIDQLDPYGAVARKALYSNYALYDHSIIASKLYKRQAGQFSAKRLAVALIMEGIFTETNVVFQAKRAAEDVITVARETMFPESVCLVEAQQMQANGSVMSKGKRVALNWKTPQLV